MAAKDFTAASVQRQGDLFSAPCSQRMIDNEQKVSNNCQRLVSAAVDELFGGEHATETVGAPADRHFCTVREAMRRLFPDLELQGPGDPIAGGTFYFRKNGRRQFHYKNLSGEKAVFD